jgi:hypothetical protein
MTVPQVEGRPTSYLDSLRQEEMAHGGDRDAGAEPLHARPPGGDVSDARL